mmetsp:Transcript_19862/g.32040  ORF Transcript_19862/g.32040 Transcript_19862/m.32040 type:complete len:214 (-) Transcript_19862:175-816(-)
MIVIIMVVGCAIPFPFAFFNLIEFLSSLDHFGIGGIFTSSLHHLDTQFLFSYTTFVGDLFGEMRPFKFVQILEIPQVAIMWIPFMVGNGSVVECHGDMFRLLFTCKFHPSFNVPLPTGPSPFLLSSFADRSVFFHQVHSRDFTEFRQEGLDFGGGHFRRDTSNIEDTTFLQFFVEIFRLGQRQLVNFLGSFGNLVGVLCLVLVWVKIIVIIIV